MNVLKLLFILFGLCVGCMPGGRDDSQSAGRRVPVSSDDPSADISIATTGCADDLTIRAKGSGEVYDILGRPKGSGEALKQLPGINMYWFAFSVFFPNAELAFSDERVNAGKSLPADKTGILGCAGGRNCIPYLGQGDFVWIAGNTKDPNELTQIDYLLPTDTVMGMFIEGVARAYPRNIFWWHEIANDEINGKKFSVTLCPLTGSSVVFDGSRYTFLVSTISSRCSIKRNLTARSKCL